MTGLPVVKSTNGYGLPVTVVSQGGMPVEIASNGFGSPIIEVLQGGLPITYVGAGGGPATPASVIMPTPSFGATDLKQWADVRKSYTNWDGTTVPGVFYDDNGHSSVSYLEDLAGNGGGILQFDKSLQPSKGPNGGILIDSNAVYMDFVNKGLLNGLSKMSMYMYARPLAGTSKRTGFFFSDNGNSQPVKALAIVNPGTLYAVGDYILFAGGTGTAGRAKVTAVDGGGGITAAVVAVPGNYTALPANPVSQASTTRPGGTATGTGATFNLTIDPVGGGGTPERAATYISNGTGGRKQTSTTALTIGGQTVSANSSTSVGAPNNAALTDTTTFHRLGQEFDFTTGLVSYFLDGIADGTGVCASGGSFNNADSVVARLGNNNALNAGAMMEIVATVIIGDVLTTGRRAALDTYLQSGT